MKRYDIVSQEWDLNGSMTVIVKDNQSFGTDFRQFEGGLTVPSGARSAAKRAMPGAKWSRFDCIRRVGSYVGYQFTVSHTTL